MQNTHPKHAARAVAKQSSKTSFTFDSGIVRKSDTAKSAKKNGKTSFYGNALGVCNGWRNNVFRPVRCRKRKRDGAESANRRGPTRNSAMHQKDASNSKRNGLSGQLSGIRQVNVCVVIASMARNSENGAITVVPNVAS